MREGPATVIRRDEYATPAYWIRNAELTFDLDPAKTIVASKLAIERHADAAPGAPLKLHGDGLVLLRCLADGESVSFRQEDGFLVIDNPPDKPSFTLEIRNTCAPDKNTQLSGLYTSGGGFFTQCEAEGFRRITYFLDRPDVMAVYTVVLRADLTVLAGDTPVGVTTSGTFSPTLKIGIALALIDTAAGIEDGARVVVDVRGRPIECEVVAPPFVQVKTR